MKRISLSLTFIILLSAITIRAQHNNELYNNGALIRIQSGAEVHVLGDVHMQGGTLNNDGLLKSDGDLYSDNTFQQRGAGITRLQNNLSNVGQVQKISGNYAVRGGQASTGVNDGSFYDLQLANDQGIVWLEVNAGAGSTAYVADARNTVDFQYGAVLNRIITHNYAAIPANGNAYSAVFGMMNPVAGTGSMLNNTATLNGNMSGVDAGYIQGKFRKAINTAGGTFPYYVGLEPAGAGAQRGFQYITLNFGANNYDVVEGYFQTGLDNTFPSAVECSGYIIDYWGGVDHGQWVFSDITGSGAGTYSVQVWPQDDNFPTKTVWLITQNNSIQGTADECGPSPVALLRSGFSGFTSQFDVAAADVNPLPVELIKIWTESLNNHIDVNWNVASEHNVSHYELLRSDDGVNFEFIAQLSAAGNSLTELSYNYHDYDVLRNKDYYYRYRSVDFDGSSEYSPVVKGRLADNSIDGNGWVLNVYPNPSATDFSVTIESKTDRQLTVAVYNAVGQSVMLKEMYVESGQTGFVLDANNWASGVYHLQITDEVSGDVNWTKIIKK